MFWICLVVSVAFHLVLSALVSRQSLFAKWTTFVVAYSLGIGLTSLYMQISGS